MSITIRFIGSFRSFSGKNRLVINLKRKTRLKDIIEEIVEKHPKLKGALIGPWLDRFGTNALILVNGNEISVLDGLATTLKNGDEVVFVPVLHGG